MGRWSDYYEKTKEGKPHELTVQAVSLLSSTDALHALDLGAGALRESKYLASLGFTVTAVDSSEDFQTFALSEDLALITPILSSFEDFQYPNNAYNLIVSSHALPFCKKGELPNVINGVYRSLRTNGIFSGNFFGPHHSWSSNESISFLHEAEVRELLRDFSLSHFEEREYDKPDASGNPVHWHMFDVIARKM